MNSLLTSSFSFPLCKKKSHCFLNYNTSLFQIHCRNNMVRTPQQSQHSVTVFHNYPFIEIVLDLALSTKFGADYKKISIDSIIVPKLFLFLIFSIKILQIIRAIIVPIFPLWDSHKCEVAWDKQSETRVFLAKKTPELKIK